MKEVISWGDITVGQYQEINLIQSELQITRFIEMMSIALDCDSQTIRDLSPKEYDKFRKKLEFLLTEPDTSDIQKTFEIDGRRYGLVNDFNLVKAGEFIDAEQFKSDPMFNLHYTLALIYRPIIQEDEYGYEIQKHKSEGFEQRAELFRDRLSITVVLGAVVFFSLLAIELSINLLDFLETKLKTMDLTKMKQTQKVTKSRKGKRSKKDGASTI